MCGIVAVLPAYDRWTDASGTRTEGEAASALAALRSAGSDAAAVRSGLSSGADASAIVEALRGLAGTLGGVLADFSAMPAGYALVVDTAFAAQATDAAHALTVEVEGIDAWLDTEAGGWEPDEVEAVQQQLRTTLDLVWAVREDRICAASRVRALAGLLDGPSPAGEALGVGRLSPTSTVGLWAVDAALDAIDRLEVRGRDSAGVHLWIRLDEADRASVPARLAERADVMFRSGAVVLLPDAVSVVYKTASIVGQLGDNVRSIREQLAADVDVQAVLRLPSARLSVLSHTRWASVGRVNAANAHPLNSVGVAGETAARYAIAVLNGDIDNHLALREAEFLPDLPGITTDAKVIPLMAQRRLGKGLDTAAAMADCLRSFEGSMAIGVQADDDPQALVFAVKGGGQGLYVGLSPFGYMVASEIFGLVARSHRYLSLEKLAGDEIKSRGAVVRVDGRAGGTLEGVVLVEPDGSTRAVSEADVLVAELTTRDVALRGYDRYLEKELAEAPTSFRKTLRGRVREVGGRLSVALPASSLPDAAIKRLQDGGFEEIVVIGQGTAAVAASGVAHLIGSLLDYGPRVSSVPASELSASRLPRDMSRTMIVAVSQSGTTTDTNRTVDLAHARGATVLAIVNRRQSDLVTKSDGVIYTGDGRDIEMAVASTKAFYAQIAAGMLLGLGLARAAGVLDRDREDEFLRTLLEIPGKLEEIQDSREAIAAIAAKVGPRHSSWAVVGSGANRIAAAEVRIKLSELCYRGVAVDAVEDKKHIDLSAESLILVCTPGSPVTQMSDLRKEVAIFSAHRNTPLVIAERGSEADWPTEHVIVVPDAHPALAWVLSTAAGHLFAYYAARAIDAEADDLRAALAALELTDATGEEGASATPDDAEVVAEPLVRFVERSLRGELRGALSSDLAGRLAAAAWYLQGMLPADVVLSAAGMSAAADPRDAVRQSLTDGVEELTRSIDSVKHQAKTVTVGTSRSGAELFDGVLARAVLEAGVRHDALSYATLLTLRAHGPVVAAVRGATRYAITPGVSGPQIRVIRKTGVAATLSSRVEGGGALSGSKMLAAQTRSVRLERGRSDGRIVLLVPEMSGQRVAGLTLVHVDLAPSATAEQLTASLTSAGNRLAELQAAVTEQDVTFDPSLLTRLPVADVLLAPVDEVAGALVSLAAPVSNGA
ncbi:MAG: SIS domain-containing protein [Kineosporiaceae bacterium]